MATMTSRSTGIGAVRRVTTSRRLVSMRCLRPACAPQEMKDKFARELPDDAYLPLGVSQCFRMEEGNNMVGQLVIEPVAACSLEAMSKGMKTSYAAVFGGSLGLALSADKSKLPEEFQEAIFCDEFQTRCSCAARTWTRSHPQENLMGIVPLGEVRSEFNVDLEGSQRRVLDFDYEPSDDDNIKQDISIDVYGRDEKSNEEKSKNASVEDLYNV